jgi:hypothetical protein
MADPTVHSFNQFLSAVEDGQLHYELTGNQGNDCQPEPAVH